MSKTPRPVAIRYFEVLPKKPLFLTAAIWAAGLNIVLMALSPAYTSNPADADQGFVVSLALFAMFFLLLMGVSRGSSVARSTYLWVDIGITAVSLAMGLASASSSGLPFALSVFIGVLSVAAWVGLLHPLSGKWFAQVRVQRENYPVGAQIARASFELKMALPWFLFAMALLNTAPSDPVSQGLALALNSPLIAIAVIIAIYQGLLISALKRSQR
jgi:hypothetical protein